MESRYLDNEDIKKVRKILIDNMQTSIFILLIFLAIIGFMLYAGHRIDGKFTFANCGKIGGVGILVLFFVLKFFTYDYLVCLRRLQSGDYVLSSYEVTRLWIAIKGDVSRDREERRYIELIPLDVDKDPVAIKESINAGDYFRAKGYKYVHKIHFYKKNGKIKEYDNGIVIDTTKAGFSFIYKGTNEI